MINVRIYGLYGFSEGNVYKGLHDYGNYGQVPDLHGIQEVEGSNPFSSTFLFVLVVLVLG